VRESPPNHARVNANWTYWGAFGPKLRGRAANLARVKDEERDAAVDEHLKALDDELARLKKMEAAMDRRIAEAEEEKRKLEEGPGAG
jgi:hypothetical protein